jgi:hypothetical protein
MVSSVLPESTTKMSLVKDLTLEMVWLIVSQELNDRMMTVGITVPHCSAE